MGTDDFERIETKTCIAMVASLVALVVSIFCVCPTLPRLSTEELNFDYLGLIIGVLSILVTVLIGWNIFSVVNINNVAEDIVRERKIIQSEQANLISEIRKTLTEEYSLMAISYENEIKKGNIEYAGHFLFFSVLLLLQLDKTNDVENIESTCNKILSYRNSFSGIKLDTSTKDMVNRNISLINCGIPKFIETRHFIYTLNDDTTKTNKQ